MQTLLSFGGLTSINHPRLHETMISGPIGGILGAAYVGKLIGNDSLICSDMGGTSFDMGVITRGQTRIENEPIMDRFKLNVPTLHLDTIGAGAGMILKVDPLTAQGRASGRKAPAPIQVPICFDRGGTEPTIADCDAILGRLNPDYFLGGKVVLAGRQGDAASSRRNAPTVLGVGLDEAAEGMIDMLEADANNALRRVISGQGIHPSEFTLLSYGGSGPLHLAGCSQRHRLPRHHHLPVRRRLLRLRLHHRRLHAPPFGVDPDRYPDRGRRCAPGGDRARGHSQSGTI